MLRPSGARRQVSADRPISMFICSPNPIPVTRPNPHEQRPRPSGSHHSDRRPVSTVFHFDTDDDDDNVPVEVDGPHFPPHPPSNPTSAILLQECVLLPSSACIPVRSSSRAAQSTRRQLFERRPETSGVAIRVETPAPTELSSVDPGVPPPAYDEL
ncbi:unnamed protein product [Echinostoma caproni]|uniref:Uncharacterized protein n=1 Tax=Echinostoma caproni TaxID=27848 RepID=A0A183APV0_9TREM|nr:unnamed protein product [Echinostoma caproni]